MKDYKRLGDYIREVNVRNRELKVTDLLGLSMSKQFRPSTSNIVGVDLSKYKIVNKNVFALKFFVYKNKSRNVIAGKKFPKGFRMHLNAVPCAYHKNCVIHNLQGAFRFGRKVDVSGGIQKGYFRVFGFNNRLF